MALLAEYALTPDIFDSASYSNDEIGDVRLQQMKEVLLSEGLVRDLRDGRWSISAVGTVTHSISYGRSNMACLRNF